MRPPIACFIAASLSAALVACDGPGRQPGAGAGAPAQVAGSPPAPAVLDDDPSRPGRTHVSFSFEELDLNDDGAIAKTESAFNADLYDRFEKLDLDADGKLTRAEFDAAGSP